MTINFDERIDRRHTQAISVDECRSAVFHEDAQTAKFPCPDDQVIRMWIADMDFAAPPCVLEALHRRVEHGIFGYTDITDDNFSTAFFRWCDRMYGWTPPKEQLCFSHGIVPALCDLVPMLTQPDEKVLFLTPSYPPFRGAAVKAGREYVCSDMLRGEDGKYRIDFEDFAQKAADPKVKLCIFCNPHNPTGRAWTAEELKRVGTICLENGLYILSDEIHCDLLRSGLRHTPLASLFPESRRIVTCMAPSKTFNIAGLHFSELLIPDEALRAEWNKTHSEGENPLSLTAATAAYAEGYDWLMELRRYLDGNFAFAADYFSKHAPKVGFSVPEATYLSWADLSAYTGKQTGLTRLFGEQAGVVLQGGEQFVHNGEGFVRMNFACPRAVLEEGLSRICTVLQKL